MKRIFILFLSVLILISLGSCDLFTGTRRNQVIFDYEEFKANKTKWETMEVVDYNYRYRSCQYPCFDTILQIQSGTVSAAEPAESYAETREVTINELISEIENSYLREIDKIINVEDDFYLKEIEITYNTTFFFPETVKYINHIPKDLIVDFNGDYNIYEFQPNQ